MESSRPVIVQRHSSVPIRPCGLAHEPKKLVKSGTTGPEFTEHISLKPLDGFTLFEVLWNLLNL